MKAIKGSATLSQKQQGHLIMLVVILIFGLNIPVNKYLYSSGLISPIAMTITRITFGAVMFWLVSLFTPNEKVERKDMLILFFGGFLGIVLNQGSFAIGLGMTSPVDASIITTCGPLFAMIIAALVLKEPITLKKAGGVVIGGAGAIYLVYSSHLAHIGQGTNWLGNAAVMGGAFFYASYLVITRPLATKYSAITIMKWMFLYALIVALPFTFNDMINAPIYRQTEIIPILLMAFGLFGATFLTYLLIPFAQQRIRPTTIAMYNNLQPLIASVVAIFLGMDSFNFNKLIAAVFILGGVYLVTQSKSKEDLDKEKGRLKI